MVTNDNSSSGAGLLLSGSFAGPQAFAQLLRDALACAAQEGWSEMVWSDPNYGEWPLREKAVIETLDAWAHAGRRLVMLANSFDTVQRYQPRFVTWRKTWGHVIDCRVSKGRDADDVPSALWCPSWAMRRLDPVRSTGVAGYEAQRRVLLKQELDECLRQSAPGFSATTLGL